MQRRRFKDTLTFPERLDQETERLRTETELMTIDELFELRELMQDVPSEKLKARKAEIERKLRTLNHPSSVVALTKSSLGPIS